MRLFLTIQQNGLNAETPSRREKKEENGGKIKTIMLVLCGFLALTLSCLHSSRRLCVSAFNRIFRGISSGLAAVLAGRVVTGDFLNLKFGSPLQCAVQARSIKERKCAVLRRGCGIRGKGSEVRSQRSEVNNHTPTI